jgi:hypothetical protein
MPFAVSFDAVSNADALSRSVADDDSEAVIEKRHKSLASNFSDTYLQTHTKCG